MMASTSAATKRATLTLAGHLVANRRQGGIADVESAEISVPAEARGVTAAGESVTANVSEISGDAGRPAAGESVTD
jgi:hypothetical protein